MKRQGCASDRTLDFSRSLSVRARVFDLFNLLAGTIKYARSGCDVSRTTAISRHCHAIGAKLSFLGFIAAIRLKSAGAGEQSFYSGKTITVIIATAPGGTGHLRYTTVLKHLPKYLAGNPTIVPQYMPGAGGMAAARN